VCVYRTEHSAIMDPDWLVELRGFEPLTPSMPWRCATSCATAPAGSADPADPSQHTAAPVYKTLAGSRPHRAGQTGPLPSGCHSPLVMTAGDKIKIHFHVTSPTDGWHVTVTERDQRARVHVRRGLPGHRIRLRPGLAIRYDAAVRRAVRGKLDLLRHRAEPDALTASQAVSDRTETRSPRRS
jgi:hypothetical protein